MAECFLCWSPDSTEKCQYCGLVSFCPDHKTLHRPDNYCYPYKAMYDAELGRHMIATRDIRALELVESEYPLVTGPYIKTSPQCLTCFRLLSGNFRCEDCNFPMCGQDCASSEAHGAECQLFRSVGLRARVDNILAISEEYCCIASLRLLLLLEQEKKGKFSKFVNQMMDHCEEIREENPDMWQFHQQFVVDYIRKTLKLGERFSEENIHKVLGIFTTNAANLDFPNEGYGRGSGLYMVYSMINHACMCNTKTFKMPDHRMEVRAQMDIKAGEQITNQYLKPEKPTFLRRPLLRDKWHFSCLCERCSDPTELGSNLAALVCGRARCQGKVLPRLPLETSSDWQCGSCSAIWPVDRVVKVFENAETMIKSPRPEDDVVEHFERVLHVLGRQLHPNNYLLLDVKQKLGSVYGNVKPYLLELMPRPLKERKIQVCQDVLDTLSKVDRGYTVWRGKMMSEVTRTRLDLAKEDYRGNGDREKLEKALMQKRFLMMYLAYYQSVLFGKNTSVG